MTIGWLLVASGCLSDLKLELTFSGPADVTAETQVQGGTDAITEAPVPFFFMLTAASPAGSYTLAVVAVDGEGNESNAQKVGLEVQ